ncbi:type III deoxyribonuclease [Deltaproteobacteria bacterium Smac51]|nr:type III deoxyribonuclease [Deltaproteobacteria bacterium Smac51]
MKLKFKHQDFQTEAVNAVADLFIGQEKRYRQFDLNDGRQSLFQGEYGFGNALLIDEATLLANLKAVQKRHNLPLSDSAADKRFCVEMETGTGKTYVYTKTILELNKRYGFTKFIIVVPSVAIREGVRKSLAVTEEHFALIYDHVPHRYFIYNSARLSDVRQFATSSEIEIMIINIDAFRKSENVINQAQDRLNGETAMRFIQDTHPIVIIDEPQSVDNTPKAKEAIASLNPLCVLRYSATHREKINTVYRLTPVDAYQMGLVKQISVSSSQVAHAHNQPYVRLISTRQDKGFRARLEIDVRSVSGVVTRKALTVKPGDDLFILSGERELYQGYKVAGIDCTPDFEAVEFDNTEFVRYSQPLGDIDQNAVRRAQIRRTIETHLEKELRYKQHGVKVLSLFFIDEVKKYRTEDGSPGPYALMFAECYDELMALPKFAELKSRFPLPVEKVHDGYFSQDKKGHYKNTKGDSQDDYDTYNTIMKDKEWLLSFDSPLRFIFSHSALKEGWDNPNVFQVCTLLEQKSTFTCRQKVGRGLRLCVNQDGERLEDKNINILHVMASESFAEFAENLQKEIEDETGLKFGVLEIALFSGLTYEQPKTVEKVLAPAQAEQFVQELTRQGYLQDDGSATAKLAADLNAGQVELPPELTPAAEAVARLVEASPQTPLAGESISGLTYTAVITEEKTIDYDEAKELVDHFQKKKYIDKSGRMAQTMKEALRDGTLDLPQKFEAARQKLETVIRRADNRPKIRDASKDVTVKLNKRALLSPEFMAIWDRIKHKTTYRVAVDQAELTAKCLKALKTMEPIPKTRMVTQTADLNIEKSGVTHTERGLRTADLEAANPLPDILLIWQEECGLTLKLGRDLLIESGRLTDFVNNPQLFIEKSIPLINEAIHSLEIDGIRYMKLAGQEYYVQEIFDSEELLASLDNNAVPVGHSLYDHIVYDSETVEKPFAQALDNDPDVKMFFKLPSKFKIETPLGSYNPDWAVYLDRDGAQKLYFVLETKGSAKEAELRLKEKLKIHCGREHFKALENDLEFKVASDWKEFRIIS